jgi:hypothetical protein
MTHESGKVGKVPQSDGLVGALMVWSALAVARVRPSGANVTVYTAQMSPRRVLNGEVEVRVCRRLA